MNLSKSDLSSVDYSSKAGRGFKPLPALFSLKGLRFSVLIIVAISLVQIASLFTTPLASAAVADNLPNRTLKYATYHAFIDCLDQDSQLTNNVYGGAFRLSDANLRSGNWWNVVGNPSIGTTQGAETHGSYLNAKVKTDTGNILCNDVLKTAADLFADGDIFKFACSFIDTRAEGATCSTGKGDFKELVGNIDKFKQVYGPGIPAMNNEMRYLLYKGALMKGCGLTPSAGASPEFAYNVTDEKDKNKKISYEGVKFDSKRVVFQNGDQTPVNLTCREIEKRTNDNIGAYADYLLTIDDDEEKTTYDGTNPVTPGGGSGSDDGTATSSCAIPGIGWVICPALNVAASLADAAYGFLATNFLRVPTSFVSPTSDNMVFNAWRQFVALGNVILVIMFLVIIFSQLTSTGLTNYGVKKMLPRLVVVALMINLSFIICALAVDLSNIVGFGAKSLLAGLAMSNSELSAVGAAGMGETGEGWAGIVGTVLLMGTGAAVGVVASGGVWLALIALIGMLLAALVALVMIFFILTIRQVLIVLLIVLAPLAFAAYLLPNTEQWFTKWRKVFLSMLLLFPIIGIIFGASSLASVIITDAYRSTEQGGNLLAMIVGGGIMVLPLFLVPSLLKKSIDSIGGLGAKLSGLGAKLGGKASGALGGSAFAKDQQRQAAMRKGMVQSGAYSGINPFSKMRSKMNNKLNNSKGLNAITGGYGGRMAAQGVALQRKQEAEDIADREQLLQQQMYTPDKDGNMPDAQAVAAKAFDTAVSKGDRIGTKAAFNKMQGLGENGVEAARQSLARNASALDSNASLSSGLREHISTNHADMKTKDNRIAKWANEGNAANLTGSGHLGNLTDAQIASQTNASLQAGANTITSDTAKRILENKDISQNIKGNQRATLEAIKNRGTGGSGSGGGRSGGGSGSGSGSGGSTGGTGGSGGGTGGGTGGSGSGGQDPSVFTINHTVNASVPTSTPVSGSASVSPPSAGVNSGNSAPTVITEDHIEAATKLVTDAQYASTVMFQRKYGMEPVVADQLMEHLETRGVVAPNTDEVVFGPQPFSSTKRTVLKGPEPRDK